MSERSTFTFHIEPELINRARAAVNETNANGNPMSLSAFICGGLEAQLRQLEAHRGAPFDSDAYTVRIGRPPGARNKSTEPRPSRRWVVTNDAELKRLYEVEGKTTPEIAALVGCSVGTVLARLKEAGTKIRPPGRRPEGTLDVDWIKRARQLNASGVSRADLRRLFAVSEELIDLVLGLDQENEVSSTED